MSLSHHFEWHFKSISENLEWNFVFIQLLCRESADNENSLTCTAEQIKEAVYVILFNPTKVITEKKVKTFCENRKHFNNFAG